MKQSFINRQVARVTGESRQTIARYGFSLLDEEPVPATATLAIAVECGGCGRIVPLRSSQFHAAEPEADCIRCEAVYPVSDDELIVVEAA